jgi:hypothetical protein
MDSDCHEIYEILESRAGGKLLARRLLLAGGKPCRIPPERSEGGMTSIEHLIASSDQEICYLAHAYGFSWNYMARRKLSSRRKCTLRG